MIPYLTLAIILACATVALFFGAATLSLAPVVFGLACYLVVIGIVLVDEDYVN